MAKWHENPLTYLIVGIVLVVLATINVILDLGNEANDIGWMIGIVFIIFGLSYIVRALRKWMKKSSESSD